MKKSKKESKTRTKSRTDSPDTPEQAVSQRDRVGRLYGHTAKAPAAIVQAEPEPDEKPLATDSDSGVESVQMVGDAATMVGSETPASAVDTTPASNGNMDSTSKGRMTMATLQFKGLSKNGKYALYSGLRTVSRLSVTNFPDQKPPQSLEVHGDLAGPRTKMTAEERKAARANAPKPTLAERVAAAEKKAAALRAKLEKAQAEPEAVTA